MRSIGALLLVVAGTTACGDPLPEEPKAAARLPAQLCSQAAAGIKKLSETGGFTYSGSGNGTLDGETWLKMNEPQRDQLLQLLAVDSACNAPEPVAEATGLVRDETGRVLSQRVVETSADFSHLADE